MSVQQSAIFALLLTLVFVSLYGAAGRHFRGEPVYYAERVQRLQAELERERLRVLWAEHQMREFQQEVAALVPTLRESSYPLRSLASVVAETPRPEALRQMSAQGLLDTGKSHFRNGDYSRAARSFESLIRLHGYSHHAIEAYFLLAESQYQLHSQEGALQTIEQMVSLFPGHELTGSALIRMGHILESRRRRSEAQAIYRSLIQLFPGRDVASQAQQALSEMEF